MSTGALWARFMHSWGIVQCLQSKFSDSNSILAWFKFILGLNFIFLLFLGMVMYDNDFKRMGNKI